MKAAEALLRVEGVIYALCDPGSGEIRYVGRTIDLPQRLRRHRKAVRAGSRTHVHNWMRSVGAPLVGVLARAPEADLNERERAWIASLRRGGARLCNGTDGGEGTAGHRHSAETRAKMSRTRKGRAHSAEHRAVLDAALRGRVQSPETRAKIASTLRGRRLSDHHREQIRRGVKAWRARQREEAACASG